MIKDDEVDEVKKKKLPRFHFFGDKYTYIWLKVNNIKNYKIIHGITSHAVEPLPEE